MKILILNGPNLDLLGLREPDIYGAKTYDMLEDEWRVHAAALGITVRALQSNHEGVLLDEVARAYREGYDGIVLNPAAYTHTSIALLDALRAVGLPTVEVHISDTDCREPFRQMSYIRPACIATVKGHGTDGYLEAMDILAQYIRANV